MKILILVTLFAASLCWWHTGHEIVAHIAKLDLIETGDEAVVAEVERVLHALDGLTQEGEHFWEEAATYPDLIKERGVKEFGEWHTITFPLNETDHEVEYTNNRNISWALNESIKTVGFSGATEGVPETLFEKS